MNLAVLTPAIVAACLAAACGVAGEPTLAEEAAFRAAVDRVAAAVVRIEPLALTAVASPAEAAAGRGPATGLVVAPGFVLTTAFAVPADVDSAVIVLPDGGRRAAAVRARDTSRGLVLLAAENLPATPPLEPVPRSELRPGQWAIAVGRGWDPATASPAVGIVSAVNRAWGKAVQTDAAISPTNYGGPLVDIAGRVIGLVAPLPADTAGMTEGTELYDAGIGFAVPLEDVLAALPRLVAGESLAAGILGIGYRSRDSINGEPVIGSVRQGSPAAKAGLRPGDRIVRIDDRGIRRIADARHAIAPRYAGDTIRLSVESDASADRPTREVTATLVATLPPWRRAVIGLITRPVAAADDKPAGTALEVAWTLPGSPADRAGLEPGDRLDTIASGGTNPTQLDSRETAAGALAGVGPGEAITLSFTRDGRSRSVEVTTIPMPAEVPEAGPPAEPGAVVEVVRLGAAEEADPPRAVIPQGEGPVGVLVWCGPPPGGEAVGGTRLWEDAAARHGVAVILPSSKSAEAWSRDDIPAVVRALATLNARRAIDPARMGIAGSGAGAAFAWLVAERLAAAAGGVALVGSALPGRAAVPPATPGAGWWVLLGPGGDDAAGGRVAADQARLERAGHAAGLLPADLGEPPPAELLCRWASLLGLL